MLARDYFPLLVGSRLTAHGSRLTAHGSRRWLAQLFGPRLCD